ECKHLCAGCDSGISPSKDASTLRSENRLKRANHLSWTGPLRKQPSAWGECRGVSVACRASAWHSDPLFSTATITLRTGATATPVRACGCGITAQIVVAFVYVCFGKTPYYVSR